MCFDWLQRLVVNNNVFTLVRVDKCVLGGQSARICFSLDWGLFACLFVCLCVCVCVFLRTYIHMYIELGSHVRLSCVCVCVCVFAHIHMFIELCLHVRRFFEAFFACCMPIWMIIVDVAFSCYGRAGSFHVNAGNFESYTHISWYRGLPMFGFVYSGRLKWHLHTY